MQGNQLHNSEASTAFRKKQWKSEVNYHISF